MGDSFTQTYAPDEGFGIKDPNKVKEKKKEEEEEESKYFLKVNLKRIYWF